MARWITAALVLVFVAGLQPGASAGTDSYRRLPMEEYVDRMKGGWLGQMAGVGWGAPTEFGWKGETIPAKEVPEWKPEMINQFRQDDLYVEMTFLRTLQQHGPRPSIRQAGIDFANTGYRLWHANKAGRNNLRSGIAPPDSGHPAFNQHADDIDYQIEADYAGLIAPGMPNRAIELGGIFGRLMNDGDGLYGGQFMGGMYARAFFTDDISEIIRAGLACIPEGSQYHECITDVLRWHRRNPHDWKKTWRRLNEKYQENPQYRRFSCTGPNSAFNIDAKINGAYVVMGLLYGRGDPERTIRISMRCGQDSDCNPSSAAGILFTTLGASDLPERFTSALEPDTTFSHTPYDWRGLVEVCTQQVRRSVRLAGGRIEKDADGSEVLVIPVQKAKPGELRQCWRLVDKRDEPRRYTEEQMRHIKRSPSGGK